MELRTIGFVGVFASVAVLTASASRGDVTVTTGQHVQLETGNTSINNTLTQWLVGGTDLGIPWDDGTGRLLIAFGDTTYDINAGGGPGPTGWRPGGTLAMSTDYYPGDGVTFSGMLTDTPGHAGEMIATASASGPDYWCIPTAGATMPFLDGTGVDFVHFFSPQEWAPQPDCAQNLRTYRSGIAYRAGGTNATFMRSPYVSWGPKSNFGWAAFMTRGDYVYMYGTPPARVGGVKLARANGWYNAVGGAWEYWDGATWQSSEDAAAFIVPPPVSELSVQFDPQLGRYLMTYLDLSRGIGSSQAGAIVLRDSGSPEGPWTEEKQLTTNAAHHGEYGGFMYPFSVSGHAFGSPSQLFFNMSEWGPYNVSLYQTTLGWQSRHDNLVTDGGFEDQLVNGTVTTPWVLGCSNNTASDPEDTNCPFGGGIDVPCASCGLLSHSGRNDAWLRASDTNWHDVHQTVAVTPNSTYFLQMWIRTSSNVTAGYAGVRTRGNTVAKNGADMCDGMVAAYDPNTPLGESSFGSLPGYTQVGVFIDVGPHSLVDVYAGFWAPGSDAWVQVDDVSLVPIQASYDSGFEMQATGAIGFPYAVEGTGGKGIDREAGLSHTGGNNAWINTTNSVEWNAITQTVNVQPYTWYVVSGWVQTSSTFGAGYFGVRDGSGTIISETSFGAAGPYTQLSVWFYTGGNTTVKAYAGYWTPGGGVNTWMRLDDFSVSL